MLRLFEKAHEEELVVFVLESQFNVDFDLANSIILAVPSKLTADELKRRIQGVTSVPSERILILFCGEVIFGAKWVPAESFEAARIVDEDSGTFRPRLWMQIVEDPVIRIKDEEPDVDRSGNEEAEIGPEQAKAKHKKKHKIKESFDLAKELAQVECSSFYDVLVKQEYDNEGAFANLTSEILRGPGLWIPASATRRILAACAQIKKRLAEKDRGVNRNHYRNINLSSYTDAHNSDENGHVELHEHATSDASVSNAAAASKNKADVRREWEAEVIRKKKAAREEAALIKAGLVRPQHDSLKEHSEELTAKIAAIRERCNREADESSGDFDEITGILYESYQRLRSVNKQQDHAHVDPPRASTAEALATIQNSAEIRDKNVTGSPTRVLRSLRSSASSASFSAGIGNGSNHQLLTKEKRPGFSRKANFCCIKHEHAVLSNREAYYAQRKVLRTLELQVLLDRIPSAASGYVTSHSLRAIAQRYLNGYGGMPARSRDPILVERSVEYCRLDLFEQRNKVRCVQPKELSSEHLVSVLPVKWFCPLRFIEGFVSLLEELDRERLEEEALCV